MSRSERLLDLIQAFRRRSRAVSAQTLADEFGVDVRTIYRDILTLQGQGVPIEGEAGVGYLLRPGYTLPPLMFTSEEIQALVLGARWLVSRADAALGLAGRNALAKIAAVLTPALKEELETTTLLVGPATHPAIDDGHALMIRQAIRSDRKLQIAYAGAGESRSERTVWPFAIGFFDHVQIMVAWCELRRDFRHFRLDRLAACDWGEGSYPEGHRSLLERWRIAEGIPAAALDLG